MRFLVKAISLISEPAEMFRTFSIAGFICTTRIPKSVEDCCKLLYCLANSCCSPLKLLIASLNSLGEGMDSMSRGMDSSSLSLTMIAFMGSKVSIEVILPTINTKDEN